MLRKVVSLFVCSLFVVSVAALADNNPLSKLSGTVDKAKAAKKAAAETKPTPAAPDKKIKGACTHTDKSLFGGCVEYAEAGDTIVKGLKMACEKEKGQWADNGTCPVAALVGKCRHKGPTGVMQTAFLYTVSGKKSDQSTCTKLAGKWTDK